MPPTGLPQPLRNGFNPLHYMYMFHRTDRRELGPAGSFLPAGGIFPGAYFSVQPPYFLEIFHKKYNFLTSNVCHGPLDAWLVPSSIGSVHDLEIEDDEF